jgi:hypothetical protein
VERQVVVGDVTVGAVALEPGHRERCRAQPAERRRLDVPGRRDAHELAVAGAQRVAHQPVQLRAVAVKFIDKSERGPLAVDGVHVGGEDPHAPRQLVVSHLALLDPQPCPQRLGAADEPQRLGEQHVPHWSREAATTIASANGTVSRW